MTSDELRAAMAALPEPMTTKTPPHWEFWRLSLWRHVVNGDDPNSFMDWPEIYHCMLVSHWLKSIVHEFNALPDKKIWNVATIETSPNSEKDWYTYNRDHSMNLIHQAYHLHRFQTVSGKQIADMETIVEIGGGYGAACLVARRLGFKGKYIIYDLPEFSLLQQWYLSQAGVDGVEFITELPKENFFHRKYFDLLIGLYSLSEMPFELRQDIFDKFPAFNYLLLYSQDWVDYDNKEYFQERISFDTVRWKHEEIDHLPDRGNWYSFGWDK